MKSSVRKYGSWSLVAGAAEGLGRAFAEALAKEGMHVVLIDNNEDKLYETAGMIENRYGISTKKLLTDLSDRESIPVIFEALEGIDCRLMIYNAAYGPVKSFSDNTPAELDYYIDLNCRTPLNMVYHFINQLPEHSPAGIILMSSLAGLFGTNLVAPYGATKAFNLNLAEGLAYEFQSRKIDIMACCAGATDTPNYRNTKPEYGLIRPSVSKPEKVAEACLKKLGTTHLYIPGLNNRLTYFILNRVLPRKWAAGLMNRTMAGMYKHRERTK